MIVNMTWHVLQTILKCYFVPLSRLSYIYWLIHFNIVDQGNTKFESIYAIDKYLIFASDCTNKCVVTLTIKDDDYGFFYLSPLITSYWQSTEKVKCICVLNSNLHFSTGSLIIIACIINPFLFRQKKVTMNYSRYKVPVF